MNLLEKIKIMFRRETRQDNPPNIERRQITEIALPLAEKKQRIFVDEVMKIIQENPQHEEWPLSLICSYSQGEHKLSRTQVAHAVRGLCASGKLKRVHRGVYVNTHMSAPSKRGKDIPIYLSIPAPLLVELEKIREEEKTRITTFYGNIAKSFFSLNPDTDVESFHILKQLVTSCLTLSTRKTLRFRRKGKWREKMFYLPRSCFDVRQVSAHNFSKSAAMLSACCWYLIKRKVKIDFYEYFDGFPSSNGNATPLNKKLSLPYHATNPQDSDERIGGNL